jgi:hypothetical protein
MYNYILITNASVNITVHALKWSLKLRLSGLLNLWLQTNLIL